MIILYNFFSYFDDIFKDSGFAQLADQYGPWFTHSGSPRAKIFARDQHKIVDIDSMMYMMRCVTVRVSDYINYYPSYIILGTMILNMIHCLLVTALLHIQLRMPSVHAVTSTVLMALILSQLCLIDFMGELT